MRQNWCLQAAVVTSRREESASRDIQGKNELEAARDWIGDLGACV